MKIRFNRETKQKKKGRMKKARNDKMVTKDKQTKNGKKKECQKW